MTTLVWDPGTAAGTETPVMSTSFWDMCGGLTQGKRMYARQTNGGPGTGRLGAYQPALDAADGWRDYLWQLEALRVGYDDNVRRTHGD